MKVTPDVTSNPLRRASKETERIDSRKNSINSPQNRALSQSLEQSIGSRLNMEHSLADALTIAQVSASLVQKAMVVSSRLRNIAAEALASGRIDATALQETVSQIPEDLTRYGERYQSPPQVPVEPAPVAPPPRDDLAEVMGRIRETAGSMEGGNIPEGITFDEIDRSLGTADRAVKMEVNSYEAEIFQATGVSLREVSPPMPESVALSIAGAPEKALAAQGNIVPEAAAVLT